MPKLDLYDQHLNEDKPVKAESEFIKIPDKKLKE
jgi:hypothetical protein